MVTFVDDILVIGPPNEIAEMKSDIKKRFNISELGRLSKHLGVYYKKGRDDIGDYFELSMEKYRQELIADYEAVRGKAKLAKTPGFPGESLIRETENEVVDLNDYRRILGKATWFTQKILPENANANRELSVSMDHPTETHWKSLGRMIGYIKQADCRLKIRKPVDLLVRGFSDSNYATNKETRKSVTGYILTLGGAFLIAASRSQKSTSLSSCEAEYVAASTAAVDIKYIQMILEELVPEEVTSPATLLIDNTAAMHLIENDVVGSRTKHIDVKMHHIKDMRQGPKPRLTVEHVKTDENMADLQTKNVTENINTKLGNRLKNGDFMQSFKQRESAHCVISSNTSTREDVEQTGDVDASATQTGTLTAPRHDQSTHEHRNPSGTEHELKFQPDPDKDDGKKIKRQRRPDKDDGSFQDESVIDDGSKDITRKAHPKETPIPRLRSEDQCNTEDVPRFQGRETKQSEKANSEVMEVARLICEIRKRKA